MCTVQMCLYLVQSAWNTGCLPFNERVFVSDYLTGIVFNDGPIWKDLRRVTMTTMREFGVGKKSLEKRVQEEAHAIMDILDKCEGQEVNMRPLLAKCTSNIICSIIFGSRYVTLEKIRWKKYNYILVFKCRSSLYTPTTSTTSTKFT